MFVAIGKRKSNFLFFQKLNDVPPLPVISGIAPSSGTVGQYATISGSNFGADRGNGRVYFGDVEASYDFPADCSASLWSDGQILVKVPKGLPAGKNSVVVKTSNWTVDSSKNGLYFNYLQDAPLLAGVCKITPDRGPVNSKTTLIGENFGNSGTSAKVFFNALETSGNIFIQKQANAVEVTVPDGALSGPVKLNNGAGDSNTIAFQVGSCSKDSDCSGGNICYPVTTSKQGQCLANHPACFMGPASKRDD